MCLPNVVWRLWERATSFIWRAMVVVGSCNGELQRGGGPPRGASASVQREEKGARGRKGEREERKQGTKKV